MPHKTIQQPILIVDDEPQNLAALRQILMEESDLIFARSGQTALDAARNHSPKMILLDVDMPEMDGYEVCRRLKADPATEEIPIIFITSRADPVSENLGFEIGAVDYIAKPVFPAVVLARVRAHLGRVQASKLKIAYAESVMMLGKAGHFSDTDTGVHIWRMAAYSGVLAKALGWGTADAELIELAAPMHDTGKIGIPRRILRKPGPLDEAEWVVMKTHTQVGFDILSQSKSAMFKMAADIALYHHEKWDGTGYPMGLKGTDIPESARIVAVADVFDALTMKRPYKDAWPQDRAIAAIQEGSGKHFEPRVVDAFMGAVPELLKAKERFSE